MSTTPRPRILSGMRPTGKLHLGNYMGALANWVKLQDSGVYDTYFFIADWHALTTDYADPSQIRKNISDVALDYLAAGLDPEKSVLFVQSHVPQHAELHLLLSMITSLGWLERVPTYKEQQQNLSGKDLTTYGFLGYPLLQAADILIYRPRFVPVGQDQVSHVELTREVARRFNAIYKKNLLPEPDALLTPSPKLPGTDGRKMSKSYANTIGLSDPPKLVREKLEKMSNGGQRITLADAGYPDICPVFDLHKVFSSVDLLFQIGEGCSSAKISCMQCKAIASDSISNHLQPIQSRRQEYELNFKRAQEVLEEGSRKATIAAEETMTQVREAMGMMRSIPFPSLTIFDNYSYETNQPIQYSLKNYIHYRTAPYEQRRDFLIDQWKTRMVPRECVLKQSGERLFITDRNKRVLVATATEHGRGEFPYQVPNKSYEVIVLLAWDGNDEAVLHAVIVPQKVYRPHWATIPKSEKEITLRLLRKDGRYELEFAGLVADVSDFYGKYQSLE